MKDIVPETLEEALKVIEKQKLELHEKESEIQKKESELQKKDSELQKKDSELQKQQEEIIKARVEIERLNEQLAIKRAREYAARSEKSSHINSDQKELPFDIENQSLENAVKEENSELYEETEIPVSDKSKSTRKSNAGRKAASKINGNLPKRRYVITLSESERICDKCGTEMTKVRVQVSERIVHVPSYEYIEVIEKEVYECPNCVNDDDTPVTKIASDKRIIERSIATPELLAHVFMGKYQRHTPFYCQEESYNWQGINLSRQNMCSWQQKVYKALMPLENQFRQELKKGKFLQMDETPLEVMKVNEQEVREEYWDEDRHRKKETEKTETHKKCYMWVVRGGEETHPVHLYNFKWTRSGKNVLEFLDGFEGCVLQSDGYSGYDSAVDFWNENHPEHKLTHSNCNIHARRYFADAVKATGSKTAKEAVKIYEEIFTAENKLRDLFREKKISETDFLRLRKEKVKPIFDKFHSWLLEKQQTAAILNSSKTAEAINYCLKRWDKLTNYLNYSFLTPDTNAAERAVKPFVMARKNFLFSGSGTGARSTCFMFTLIETAKANSKNPEDYLRCLFEKAPYAQTAEDWNKLLPWNIEITPFKMRGEWVE